jgi:hypothetical protein
VHDYYDVEKVFSDYKDKLENIKLTISPGDCSAKMQAMFTTLGFEIAEQEDTIALIKCTKNLV